jgi:ADP-heptose:LPS heptosyltransferase
MIKICLFYFFGRLYELLEFNQLASIAYSKIIKHRVFFLDTHKRLERIFKRSNQNFYVIAHGGVGDLLQCLPNMLSHPKLKYIVASHFKSTDLLFESLNIKTQKIYTYKNLFEYRRIRESVIKSEKYIGCPRNLFFTKSPFKVQKRLFHFKRKTVGVHISSSLFAPKKSLPVAFLRLLVNTLLLKNFNVIFFSTKEEFKVSSMIQHKNLKSAHDIDITKNLSLVEQCDFFIGSDSAFKTMSAMLKIPTIVLMHNDKNAYRDRVFIDPYVKKGVMSVYKYEKMNKSTMNDAIDFVMHKIISK